MACLFGHKWNGCKCARCGKSRDENHDWDGCKCEICEKSFCGRHNEENGLLSQTETVLLHNILHACSSAFKGKGIIKDVYGLEKLIEKFYGIDYEIRKRIIKDVGNSMLLQALK